MSFFNKYCSFAGMKLFFALLSIIFGIVGAYFVPMFLIRIYQIVFSVDLSDDYGVGFALVFLYPVLVVFLSVIFWAFIKKYFGFFRGGRP